MIGAALRHFVRIESVVRQLQIYIYIYISPSFQEVHRDVKGRVDVSRGVSEVKAPKAASKPSKPGKEKTSNKTKGPSSFPDQKGIPIHLTKGASF